ncbi:MAG: hypothetical protein WBB45_11535 [Cyclobacteriaceae bacterium]
MHTTAEIRWFWEGECPGDLHAWLEGTGYPATEPEARTDSYLLTGSETGSVKLREGKLEAKLLLSSIILPAHLAGLGCAAAWNKWSGPEIAQTDGITHIDEQWLQVMKKRRVATYLPGRMAYGKPNPGEPVCEVETGIVSLNGLRFTSLCMECHAPLQHEADVLTESLNQLVSNKIPPFLTEFHSFSYPAWLATQV